MDISHGRTALAFVKFVLVGAAGLGVTLAVTYLLTDILHIWYFWSFLAATFITWTFVFLANALFTFKEGSIGSFLTVRHYLSFMLGYLVVFWINAGTVYVLTSVLSVPYLLSIIMGTLTTTALTFILSKFVIFSRPAQDRDVHTTGTELQ
jgi:putative flippase GtrA